MRGEYPYYGANGVVDHINQWLFDEPLVLVAEDGGYFGESATRPIAYKVTGRCWVNNHAHVLRPRAGLDVDWLHHVLAHWDVRPYIHESTLSKLNQADLRRIVIPLPPLAEQRRAAEVLGAVDEALQRRQAVIEQLEVVKRALLGELLARGLPGRHREFRQTEAGLLPASWQVLTYGQLAAPVEAAIQSGPFGSELRHSEFTRSGRLVIGIDNVLDGRFSLGANHRIPEEKFQALRRFQARPLDLLITVMATVGRCCVVPEGTEPAMITKHVYRLTVDRTRASPHFLVYCLYGVPRLARQVRGSAQGLSRPGLNKSLLLPLEFPVPPLQEQEEIVRMVQSVEARVEAEQRALEGARQLKASLREALLRGRVR